MTRAEAIEILKKLIEAMQGHVTVLPTPERIAAIRLAIASLETDEAYRLEYEQTTKNDLGVDCISREQALEPYKILENTDTLSVYTIRQNLAELPSVTPQEPQSFKWCTDCKEYDQEKHCCHRWSKTIRDTVEEMKQEYIEREVLDKIRAEITDCLKALDDVEKFNIYLPNEISGRRLTYQQCLGFIDKYKAETEAE